MLMSTNLTTGTHTASDVDIIVQVCPFSKSPAKVIVLSIVASSEKVCHHFHYGWEMGHCHLLPCATPPKVVFLALFYIFS
jgi:hypothetical protein